MSSSARYLTYQVRNYGLHQTYPKQSCCGPAPRHEPCQSYTNYMVLSCGLLLVKSVSMMLLPGKPSMVTRSGVRLEPLKRTQGSILLIPSRQSISALPMTLIILDNAVYWQIAFLTRFVIAPFSEQLSFSRADGWKKFTGGRPCIKSFPGIARSGAFTEAMGESIDHEIERS